MVYFFENTAKEIFAVVTNDSLDSIHIAKLEWLFGGAQDITHKLPSGVYIGPRKSMVSPWSTNAVDIVKNMGLTSILRIEVFLCKERFSGEFDAMLMQEYPTLTISIFDEDRHRASLEHIYDIAAYNRQEGLSLSDEEVTYLESLSETLGRPLTDAEVFGFSQVNSEHCRHKIFNGVFVIDGQQKDTSLFKLIKKTSSESPNNLVSAYADNVAFIKGPDITQFAPQRQDIADYYHKTSASSVLSLKAETHNFPTTVEPFNGAATGSGGEIRDRMAGGQGSIPLAGTAVYMTPYGRIGSDNKPWENMNPPRNWLYQTPLDILIKASNGASDFGNKFGQPLIAGSVYTFEYFFDSDRYAFDKVIMLAGGIGYSYAPQSLKKKPKKGDLIIVLGGDGYRIGMGGAAVSSADTGEHGSSIELNAVQRSNPEMQKRVFNVVRSLVESQANPIISIHDHGAGGHLNCLSELVEDIGGIIDIDALPVGDPTLSFKEILGNESQERMGLLISPEHLPLLESLCLRERAPLYVVGHVTGDHKLIFRSSKSGENPIDLDLTHFFGSSPKTVLEDNKIKKSFTDIKIQPELITQYIEQLLTLEAVACKDWLTNKVDRCVGGRVAKQQCSGVYQLPLNNCGVMALDYDHVHGIATSIGHASGVALIDAGAGSRIAIAEALTNIVWAPFPDKIANISLSANWMWPCRNPGEDARLYEAVKACSDFAIGLGINIPTGKDSLSMKQKYPDGDVISPGTVIISAMGHTHDITRVVEPPICPHADDVLYHIDLSSMTPEIGGSSFAQILNTIGNTCPDILDVEYFKNAFNAINHMVAQGWIAAGHDVGSGGLVTTLLEMCFSIDKIGLVLHSIDDDPIGVCYKLFAENPGVILQFKREGKEQAIAYLTEQKILAHPIANIQNVPKFDWTYGTKKMSCDISALRRKWFETSYHFDKKQTKNNCADFRYANFDKQPLKFLFPGTHTGHLDIPQSNSQKPKAGILREQGSNSERELAHALFLAGFDVKDIHMTDLISGRETLTDIQFLGAVGGFSNSDVLGSAKGWAGSFKYNNKAKSALEAFFKREDTLTIGICNGCQLFMELGLITNDASRTEYMAHNRSGKHESNFISVSIPKNQSIMLSNLAGCTLGVWISHGEGRFVLPKAQQQYPIAGYYTYDEYPANPNGSDYNTAMLCSDDGRHLVSMPHIERSIFKWNWAYYDPNRPNDIISPWILAFKNAYQWIVANKRP